MTPPPGAAATVPATRGRSTAPARPRVAPPRPRRVSGPARPPARPPAKRGSRASSYAHAEHSLVQGLIGALDGVSRSGALDRLIRGRIWIGVITFALIGIVTLQLLVLQLNASIGRSLVREAQLQRANAALSIEGSELAGGERVETQAAHLGMQLVPEGSLRFLTGDPRADIARAAATLKAPAHAAAASSGEAGAATPAASTGTTATASGAATETSPSGVAPATATTQPTSSTGESASSSAAAAAPASEAASPSVSGTSSASAPTGAATSSEAPTGAAVGEAGGSGQPNGGG